MALTGAGTLGAVTGATTVTAGTLDLGATTQTQNGGVTLTGGAIQNGTLSSSGLFDMRVGAVSAVLTGAGGLTKSTAGTVTLSGINTYTGATTVNAGTLTIAAGGSIASAATVNGGTFNVDGTSAGVTVNAGGLLGGTGTTGSVTVNGGVLAPGNSIGTITVQGNLTFNSGSYRVEVSPTNADRTNVTGTATLTGATVDAQFASGAYLTRSYTILTAGTRSGTFSGLTTTNLPAGFIASLGYATANQVTLDLLLFSSSSIASLPSNQQAPGNAIVNFFNNGGALPPGFVTLAGLTGPAQQAAFAQVSGEGGNGAVQQTLLNAVDKFIATMLDPFIIGRGTDGANGGAIGYADAEDDALAYAGRRRATKAERDAYRAVTPRDPRASGFDLFVPRWSVWAAGYGGTASVDGNAATGTHSTSSSIYGTAVGADYRAGRDTLIGFAMAGGGTHFSTEQGLGKGRADIFQIGGYGRHNFGPLYIAGALAYGWQDVSVERTITVAGTDQLRSNFDAHTFAARAEAGYRLATALMGVTPYGALQVTSVRLPGYTEFAVSGSNQFALGFAAQTETNLRSELGVRGDKSFVTDTGILTFRSRLAWAHDSNTDRVINPTFQSLPGAAFTVNGAKPAADGVLVSGGADMKWRNGWSVAGMFEGEFSRTTESYAGKGAVRYAW